MGFSMNRPSMDISYGGESKKQQKSNLMKDNPVAKHASAMNMYGKKDSPAHAYGKKTPMHQQEEETPLEVTAEGKKKIAASDANPAFKKAIANSPATMYGKKKSPVPMYGKKKKKKSPLNVTEGKKGGLETAKKQKAKKEQEKLDKKLQRGPSGKLYAKSVSKEKRMKELGIESPATIKGDPKKFKPKELKKKKLKK